MFNEEPVTFICLLSDKQAATSLLACVVSFIYREVTHIVQKLRHFAKCCETLRNSQTSLADHETANNLYIIPTIMGCREDIEYLQLETAMSVKLEKGLAKEK